LVKGPDIYIPPLAGKPEQQRFTIRSGVLTSGHPIPERTDFGPTVAARQIHLCRSWAFTL